MTSPARFEQDLPELLAELAPVRRPDYEPDIVRRTAPMRQRPAWMFPERWLPVSVMTTRAVATPPVRWRIVGLAALLLIALAVGLVAIAGSRPRVPAPFGPAANGLVAYSEGGDIFTVDPATGVRRAIVTGAETDQSPAFSLDGTRVAFVRATHDGPAIVVADADGGNRSAVALPNLASLSVDNVAAPSWSPDGRLLAVVTDDHGDAGSLWIVDSVARSATKVDGVLTDYEAVQWRPPDGRQLMVTVRTSGGVQFALVSAVDGTVQVLPTPTGGANGLRPGGWSVDGRRFAYASDQVHVMNLQDGTDVMIPPSQAQDGGGWPQISNDGRRVLFLEQKNNGSSWLSVARSDGSAPAIRISDVYRNAVGTHYLWSPDDSAIAFEPFLSLGPDVAGAPLLLDPAGGTTSTPSWLTNEVQAWQRLAR